MDGACLFVFVVRGGVDRWLASDHRGAAAGARRNGMGSPEQLSFTRASVLPVDGAGDQVLERAEDRAYRPDSISGCASSRS